MFFFKTCPKCQGDMYLDRDSYGTYRKCLQCGHIVEQERQPISSKSALPTGSLCPEIRLSDPLLVPRVQTVKN